MNKLLSVILAAMFAVATASAFAASPSGEMKDDKKIEKKQKKAKHVNKKSEKMNKADETQKK